MQEMKGSCLPSSALQTTQCIEQHKKFVGQVFDDPLLVQLQQTGPDLLREFEEIRRQSPNNHDFRFVISFETFLSSKFFFNVCNYNYDPTTFC